MSWRSSRPELRRAASGWGSLWESSSFAPWFILNTFRDASGVVPEWPWISGLMRKASSRPSAPSMRFSVLLNSCDNFFSDSSLNFLWNLGYVVFLWSGNFEFCAKLLLGCSSQFSLIRAASFLLVRVAISEIVLSFLLFIPFPGGKHSCLHAKSRYK